MDTFDPVDIVSTDDWTSTVASEIQVMQGVGLVLHGLRNGAIRLKAVGETASYQQVEELQVQKIGNPG